MSARNMNDLTSKLPSVLLGSQVEQMDLNPVCLQDILLEANNPKVIPDLLTLNPVVGEMYETYIPIQVNGVLLIV